MANLVAMAEWFYKINYHSSIRMTPFESFYGFKLPRLSIYEQSALADLTNYQFVQDRLQVASLLK